MGAVTGGTLLPRGELPLAVEFPFALAAAAASPNEGCTEAGGWALLVRPVDVVVVVTLLHVEVTFETAGALVDACVGTGANMSARSSR